MSDAEHTPFMAEAGETRVLEVADVTKRFGGVAAVSRCSIALQPGRIYGLIGPNG